MKLTDPARLAPGADNVGTALRNRPAMIEALWQYRWTRSVAASPRPTFPDPRPLPRQDRRLRRTCDSAPSFW
jgi:hypothetical protein